MTYRYFKDLARRADSDKVLRDKAFNITRNLKYDGYQRGLGSMIFLIKNPQVVALNLFQINNLQMNVINQLLNNLKEEQVILFLKTIFAMLIYLICNYNKGSKHHNGIR